MRKLYHGLILVLALMLGFHSLALADSTTVIPGDPYLGQKPPTLKPELFAPGIISDAGYRLHGVPAFSPSGDEVFWPIVPPSIMHMQLVDSSWSEPRKLSLDMRRPGFPTFSPDGSRLFLQGAHPSGYGGIDIWYMQKTDSGWSDPQNLGSPPNSESFESQPSLTVSQDLVFTGTMDSVGWNRGIFLCEYDNGKYSEPELLPGSVNTPAIEYTPFIPSDGSYLLFSSSRPSTEESDLKLYVAFRDDDGGWSEPQNLSKAIGIESSARFPAISTDGKFLFFYSEGNVFWMSSAIIDSLRPE